jgi:hypothetical protein
MEWGKRLSEQDHPARPALTLTEAMGLGTLDYLGVPYDGLDNFLYWRRRVRAGQVNGIGTEPRQERLRWRS